MHHRVMLVLEVLRPDEREDVPLLEYQKEHLHEPVKVLLLVQ